MRRKLLAAAAMLFMLHDGGQKVVVDELPNRSAAIEVNRAWREGVMYGARQVVAKGCTVHQFLTQHPFNMKDLSYAKP